MSGDAEATVAAAATSSPMGDNVGSERWTAAWSGAGQAYSRALSMSMKKIMSSRPRMIAMKTPAMGSSSPENPSGGGRGGTHSASRESELHLFTRFADAVRRKEKEEMAAMLTQHPQLMRVQNEEGKTALHLVCALVPNYFYVDLIDMIVCANQETPASLDESGQTPLHVLCQNPSITAPALSILLGAMPVSAAMRDKHSNLAVHYLCQNLNCTLDMLQLLGQPDTYIMKNDDSRTPLHCLAASSFKMDTFLYLLHCCPDAASVVDTDGRSVLHWVCDSEYISLALLSALLPVAANAPCKVDEHMDLPLHLLCQNRSVSSETLKRVLQANPESIYNRTENAMTALHLLCANESITSEMLSMYLSYDKQNTVASISDTYGATPLHILSMNESITANKLRVLLLSCSDDSFTQDVHGRSPLHYLCMNRAITSELVWLFLERTQDLVREIDADGKMPLHHLCANLSFAPITLEILYDACPSAAMVTDKELRLPIQYLADNACASTETAALLISGPSSYRLRYDFLGVVGSAHAVSFHQNQELVYLQTNLVMDSKSSGGKVWIKFFSSENALEHERAVIARLNAVTNRLASSASSNTDPKDYSIQVHDQFDDAKRRVSVGRVPSTVAPEDHFEDTSVTLHYGLVTEAPLYTLESLYTEKLEDLDSVSAVLSDIGECLHFWHREALVVHGNISLECVGQIAQRGLRLLQFHTSHELHIRHHLGVNAFKLSSVPPEAARSFLAGETFEPTVASDIWQFGCLIYHLATGTPLLKAVVPWAEDVGQTQALHLISALTDEIIRQSIDKVHESLRCALQVMLVVNPGQRWTIDRIMHIDAFRDRGDASLSSSDDLQVRLQRHAEREVLSAEHQRSSKHTLYQLEFIKKEQQLLRGQFLATKTLLRETDEVCETLRLEVEQLRLQLEKVNKQKCEAQQEVRVFARNHQSMTHQLHTTMQMLVNLVPLAKKVYGTRADEFLSTVLSQAAGAETTSLSTIDIGAWGAGLAEPSLRSEDDVGRRPRRKSAVQMVKAQLQKSALAHGCLHTWANSPPPPILEPYELSFRSEDESDGAENCRDFSNPQSNYVDSDSGHDPNEKPPTSGDQDENQSHASRDCFLVETEDEGEEQEVARS